MKGQQVEITKKYISKYNDMSNAGLAKLMYKENKLMFKNQESARASIRYVRGAHGRERRTYNTVKSFFKTDAIKKAIEEKTMPESDYVDPEPFIFPVHGRGLIFGDVHIPFHDKKAIEIMISHSDKNLDFILLNGDIMDMHELSYFLVDPTYKNFAQEVKLTIQFLEYLRNTFRKTKLFLKFSNHEARYERFSMEKVPELYRAGAIKTLRELLGLGNMGIVQIESNKIIHMNKLNVIHGHEYKSPIISPVNPARGIFLKSKESTLTSHFHTASTHSGTSIRDKHTTCWSIGALCGLHPKHHNTFNEWCHGFAEIEIYKDDFMVSNKKILEGRIFNA